MDEIMDIKYQENLLTEIIIKCIIQVHKILGPGFLENIYRKALLIELKKNDLKVENEKEIQIFYKNELIGNHRLDILVEKKVIIELKTVENLHKMHYAQIRSYLIATDLKIGILVNFSDNKADFRRIIVE
jgi:GxxExxY protein